MDKMKAALQDKLIGFDHAKETHNKVYNEEHHKAHFGHELVAGGAAFEAMKVFEDRQRKKGEPVNHAFAKEMLAGIAAAEVDKLVETKGLDHIDRQKAKHHAEKQAEHLYDQHYGKQGEMFDP
ncbi:cipC-like antibiotic response protein [Pseudomassariella vexata]|uniref:CipC-like antibiotic response protein n=1 Tax=Pseudomassariella vexata TaxID=1141098 RepID=A0A1Y2E740_9PEZI|nr:cipC-like antibiotic response protein [Pseudomassariella vexata]ORY67247.1 cipC-like antibiotic response protein [Pseudomassariella vexata]